MRRSFANLSFLSVFIACYLPVHGEVLSVRQAADSIRKFEGLSHLRVAYLRMDWDEVVRFWNWPLYMIGSRDEQVPGVMWYVCPYSGRVVCRRDFDVPVWIDSEEVLKRKKPQQMLPLPTLYQKAVSFTRKYDAGFDPSKYRVTLRNFGTLDSSDVYAGPYSPDVQLKAYSPSVAFAFDRAVVSDVRLRYVLTDECRVRLNSETGRVHEWRRPNYPLRLSLVPKVSREEAERIALGYYNRPEFTSAKVKLMLLQVEANSSYPDCAFLCWYVSTRFVPSGSMPGMGSTQGLPVPGILHIHAQTGEILMADYALAVDDEKPNLSPEEINSFRSLPRVERSATIRFQGRPFFFHPLPIEDNGHVFVKSTFAWLMGVQIREDKGGGGLQLEGVQKVRVSPNELLRRGKTMFIPLDRLAEASQAKIHRDPQTGDLDLDPRYPRPKEPIVVEVP